jgi:hypothetical protein
VCPTPPHEALIKITLAAVAKHTPRSTYPRARRHIVRKRVDLKRTLAADCDVVWHHDREGHRRALNEDVLSTYLVFGAA